MFQNQPPFSAFNASFENKYDALYLMLNKIDDRFLQDDSLDETENESDLEVFDPRTNQEVKVLTIYHDRTARLPTFVSPVKSQLKKAEQEACLRVLLNNASNESDFEIWQSTVMTRQQEGIEMQKHVLSYENSRKEVFHEPIKQLFILYQKWYETYASSFLQLHNQVQSFATYKGIPNLRNCSHRSSTAEIDVEPQIIYCSGHVLMLENGNASVPPANRLCGSMESILDKSCGQYRKQTLDKFMNEFYDVFIPLDTLLFLITAGDYPDLPTEVFLEIEESRNGDRRINFDRTIPARTCGRHTNSRILEAAYQTHLSMSKDSNWLHVLDLNTIQSDSKITYEICGITDQPLKYAPRPIEDFLTQKPAVMQNTNESVVRWQLSCPNNSCNSLTLLTSLQIPATFDKRLQGKLGCLLLKLEGKAQFGCEWMTKYELIKARLQLKLLKSSEGICKRLRPQTFHILLDEQLNMADVESHLRQHYFTEVSALLGGFLSIFNYLKDSLPGKYLLRYSETYNKNFLLCTPTTDTSKFAVSNFFVYFKDWQLQIIL